MVYNSHSKIVINKHSAVRKFPTGIIPDSDSFTDLYRLESDDTQIPSVMMDYVMKFNLFSWPSPRIFSKNDIRDCHPNKCKNFLCLQFYKTVLCKLTLFWFLSFR